MALQIGVVPPLGRGLAFDSVGTNTRLLISILALQAPLYVYNYARELCTFRFLVEQMQASIVDAMLCLHRGLHTRIGLFRLYVWDYIHFIRGLRFQHVETDFMY